MKCNSRIAFHQFPIAKIQQIYLLATPKKVFIDETPISIDETPISIDETPIYAPAAVTTPVSINLHIDPRGTLPEFVNQL